MNGLGGHADTILVASDSATDAALVKNILDRDYQDVVTSTNPDCAVADCDRAPPSVLILAFDTLVKAQRYFLGVCRHSRKLGSRAHRTLVLCSVGETRLAYDLCRRQLFDDYILFWPATNDPMRLPMAVHIALRELAVVREAAPTAGEFASQARHLSGLEGVLTRQMAEGVEQFAGAELSVARVGREVGAVLDDLARRLGRDASRQGLDASGVVGLQTEIARIAREEIQPRFRSVAESIEPLTRWAGDVSKEVQPHLQSARALQGLADRLLPRVLVVDDDEFQHRIVAKVLASENYRLEFASSGAEALGLVDESPPDLVLMDIMMPDMDGTETTRRLRAQRRFAKIPIVMMTGNSVGEVVSESIRAGATDFVVKPIDRAKLIQKIANALRVGASVAEAVG